MQESLRRNVFVRELLSENQTLRLFIITALIFVAFSLLLGERFFSVRNLQSMAVQFPEFGILAFAILITMLTGGIDLSIVGAANLSAIVAALILTRLSGDGGAGVPLAATIPLAMVAALAVASLCGLFNGFLVSRIGITPILATLGTGSLYTGLSYVITGGPAITTTQLAFIGNGTIAGVPIPVIVFIVLAIVFAVMLNRTSFGFNVYMLGTNPRAALFSGIHNERVLMRTYWLAGLVAGIAGIIFLARANSAKPDYGATFILLTVLIAILGGVRYTGGFGTVSGLVLSVLSIQFLSTGLNMLMLQLSGSSAAIFFRQFAWGALLLLVMVVNYYVEQRRQRST
ncbi:ABC transporter permease [Caldilinea sp.]|uniref:ABC transporter permease n=1 Tax=Caldilinea sp. TaxID=2293560 RepID=UPI0021DF1AD5|nr:ABC transporter permease [Caldilinea sp.]GIV70458.1 MAG: ABC transporter permease [Caldilinea sp.]